MSDVDDKIQQWIEMAASRGFSAGDLQGLEERLRAEMEVLQGAGLSVDEAWLIATRRVVDALPDTQVNSRVSHEKASTQLNGLETASSGFLNNEFVLFACAALLSALLGQVLDFLGIPILDISRFAIRTTVCVVPVLIVLYYFFRGYSLRLLGLLGIAFGAILLAVTMYPYHENGSTLLLTNLHLPMIAWLLFGLADTAGQWRNTGRVWDFVRFTGEFFIYCVLLGLGGIVLVFVTTMLFESAGFTWIEDFMTRWVGVSGLLGIPAVAAYLVERKRGLFESIAPLLARVFIPLFLGMNILFILVASTRLSVFASDRDMLILVDILLALVTGMVLYDLSARADDSPFNTTDLLSLLLMLTTLVIDAMALGGIVSRLSQFGLSANRVAALGENLLLFVNLAGLSYGYVRFQQGKASRQKMLIWQVYCLPAYFIWFALVIFALPPVFSFA